MKFSYLPKGVCSSKIEFELEDNIVKNIRFTGGCNGNLKALGRLVDGMTVEEIEDTLSDITCENKLTSCSAQLAVAVRLKYEESCIAHVAN